MYLTNLLRLWYHVPVFCTSLLWNCLQGIVCGLNWWLVNICSDYGLVLSGNKSLPEPMLTKIYGVTRPQWIIFYSMTYIFAAQSFRNVGRDLRWYCYVVSTFLKDWATKGCDGYDLSFKWLSQGHPVLYKSTGFTGFSPQPNNLTK